MSDSILIELYGAVIWSENLLYENINIVTKASQKMKHEVEEYIEDSSLEEAADIMICLAIDLVGKGFDITKLGETIHNKMKINKERTWILQEDGTYQHG